MLVQIKSSVCVKKCPSDICNVNHGVAHKEIKTNTATFTTKPRDKPSGSFNSGNSESSSWVREGYGKKNVNSI